MINLFAHAGEAHETSGESLLHYLEVWYIALIVFVVVTYVLVTLLYMLNKSLGKTLTVMMAVYLVAGVGLYEKSPVISILSIIIGFAIALGLTYSVLMVPQKKK